MREHGVAQVIDVGANIGDYGSIVRGEGFGGTIHSFEPLRSAFERLEERSASDPLWFCYPFGLGDSVATRRMNRSSNLVSSSLLDINPVTTEHDPSTAYEGGEEVSITTLDGFRANLAEAPTWLKLDVQGYELHVLRGARVFLERVVGIDCEVSLVALYADQPLIEDIVAWLRPHGFVPTWIEPGVIHTGTGALLQADMTFERA